MEKMGSNGIDLTFRGYRGRMVICLAFRCFNVGRLMKVGKLKSRCSCGCKEVENWSSIGVTI